MGLRAAAALSETEPVFKRICSEAHKYQHSSATPKYVKYIQILKQLPQNTMTINDNDIKKRFDYSPSSPSRATPPPGGTVVPAERPLHRAWKHRAPPPAAPDGTSATEVLRWPFQGPDAARSKKIVFHFVNSTGGTLWEEKLGFRMCSNVLETWASNSALKISHTFRIYQVLYTFRCHRHPRIWATCGLGGLQHLRHPRS